MTDYDWLTYDELTRDTANMKDCFQTPEYALLPLLPFINPCWTIWEPACGKGNIVRILSSSGFNCVGTDILSGHDFILTNLECDAIITNPPYSIMANFIERCAALQKPWAMLMPVTALGGRRSQRILELLKVDVILFPRRIAYETPFGRPSSPPFATAWFCYGMDVRRELLSKKYSIFKFQ